MNEDIWRLGEIFMWIIGLHSVVLLAAFGGIFWLIWDMKKDISKIQTDVSVIVATLSFNGFDLDRHKAQGE